MKDTKNKKINWKQITVIICLIVFSLMLGVLFYVKLIDVNERAFEITTYNADYEVLEMKTGDVITQEFKISLEEVTAFGIEIEGPQANMDNFAVNVTVYDENNNVVKTTYFSEQNIRDLSQILVRFDTPINPGIYYVVLEATNTGNENAGLFLTPGNIVDEKCMTVNGEKIENSLLLREHNFLWSEDFYKDFCIIIAVILCLSVVPMYYIIFIKKAAFHWCYLCVAIIFGVLFMFVIPPYSTPDEQTHISTSFYLSNHVFGWTELQDENATFIARRTEVDTGLSPYLSRAVYNRFLVNLIQPVSEEAAELVEFNHEFAAPYALYTVPAIGVTVGRLLNLNGIATILMGTFFNLVSFLALATYAIKKVPFGKMIMAGICLLPITLQQVSSFSYDNPLIAATLVVLALGLRWCYSEERPKKSELVLYTICSIVLLLGKGGVYFMIIFLPILYKFSKDKIKMLWNKYRIQAIIFSVVSVLILLRNKIVGIVDSIFTSSETVVDTTEQVGNIIKWSGTEGYTIMELIMNPGELVKMIFNTLLNNVDWYFGTAVGQSLGWFQINSIPWLLIFVLVVVILCATIKPVTEVGELEKKDRLIVNFFSVVSCGLCLAAMLLLWTPKGTGTIMGVQGRYFLPPIIAVLFTMRTSKLQISRNIDRELLYTMFIVNIGVIYYVLSFSTYL